MKTLYKIRIEVLTLVFLFLSYVVSNASSLSEKVLERDQNGHEYVDLGLPSGTLWATCNVGATTPEDYGDYFAWAETRPKDYFDFYDDNGFRKTCNFKYYNFQYQEVQLTKYCSKSDYGYIGFTDSLTTLQPTDDAATVNWGGEWCMPTIAQWKELLANTTNTWTTWRGVKGWLFTASNGNSLFLPAAGDLFNGLPDNTGREGFYWSSSLIVDYPAHAGSFFFSSGYHDSGYIDVRSDYRCACISVRPVRSGKTNQSGTNNSPTSNQSVSPQSANTTQQAKVYSNAYDGNQVVVIDVSELRLRLGPSTSSDTFKWPDGTNRHPKVGEKFKYLGESGDFYKIDFNGNELWVSKQFSHIEDDLQTPIP